MSTTVDALRLRAVMGREHWTPPAEFGPDGWSLTARAGGGTVIVSCAEQDDGVEWVHASIAFPDRDPAYTELARLHRAAFGAGWAYHVFAPPAEHVNIHEHALHLWGRHDGAPALPNFGRWGSI